MSDTTTAPYAELPVGVSPHQLARLTEELGNLRADVARLKAEADTNCRLHQRTIRRLHREQDAHLRTAARAVNAEVARDAIVDERDALREEVEDYRAKDGTRTVRAVDAWPALRPPHVEPGAVALVLLESPEGTRGWCTALHWREAPAGTSPWVGEYPLRYRVLGWVPLPPVPGKEAEHAPQD